MLEQENDHKVGQLPREELVANMSKFRGKKACRAKTATDCTNHSKPCTKRKGSLSSKLAHHPSVPDAQVHPRGLSDKLHALGTSALEFTVVGSKKPICHQYMVESSRRTKKKKNM
eukprot:1140740-Pelagomonas_calceolata.AAC.4